MPLLLRYVLAAGLFGGLGYLLWEYFDSIYSLLLVPFFLLLREIALRLVGVLLRVGLRRSAVVVAFALMPVLWRRRSQRTMERIGDKTKLYRRYARMRWHHMPMQARVIVSFGACVLICVLAGLSGALLLLLTFLPASLTQALGGWLKGKIVPVLTRTAAARGIDRLFPLIWVKIPSQVRQWCAPRYRKLFRWTIRRLVRKRRSALLRRQEEARFIMHMKQFS